MTDSTFLAENDPSMQVATTTAIRTFKYFWRELSWEARRIIPGVELSAVKIPLPTTARGAQVPPVEHLWFGEIQFDGVTLTGTLLNDPAWIPGLEAGAPHSTTLTGISDWMYAQENRVYGGFTVHAMRRRMDRTARREHDQAWGLDFGDPERVPIVPRKPEKSGATEGYRDGDDIPEHPMSVNMAKKYAQEVGKNPTPYIARNDDGSSMLHFDALAGNVAQVKVLLDHGADAAMTDRNGKTPLALARALQWERVVQALSQPRS